MRSPDPRKIPAEARNPHQDGARPVDRLDPFSASSWTRVAVVSSASGGDQPALAAPDWREVALDGHNYDGYGRAHNPKDSPYSCVRI